MNPVKLALAILTSCEQLMMDVKNGTLSVADAREVELLVREAEGWLISTRDYLNPETPLSQGEQ